MRNTIKTLLIIFSAGILATSVYLLVKPASVGGTSAATRLETAGYATAISVSSATATGGIEETSAEVKQDVSISKIGNAKGLEEILGGSGIIYGRVIDENGRPVGDAAVSIPNSSILIYKKESALISTATNSDGTFWFKGLKTPLAGTISIVSPNHIPAKAAFRLSPPALVQNLGDIRLYSGTPVIIRIFGPNVALNSVYSFSILQPNGDKYSSLFFYHSGKEPLKMSLPRGNYEITLSANGYAEITKRAIVGDDPLEIFFEMQNGASISGRVVDRNGNPVPGASVGIFRDFFPNGKRLLSIETDDNGAFIANGLADKTVCYIETEKSGYGQNIVYNIMPGTDNVIIEMRSLCFMINGSVIEAQTGKPVEGCEVTIYSSIKRLHDTAVKTTDGDGKFSYQLYAKPRQIQFFIDDNRYVKPKPVEVNLKNDGAGTVTANIVLEWGNTLSGKITSKTTGASIGGANVLVAPEVANVLETPEKDKRTCSSNADGVYYMGGLKPGKIAVLIDAPGFAPLAQDVEITENATVLDAALSEGLTLRGTVKDDSGEPLQYASVNAQGQKFPRTGFTDTAGRFEITGLVENFLYSVEAKKNGYETQYAYAEFPDTSTVVFILKKKTYIIGVVANTRGEPLKWADVVYGGDAPYPCQRMVETDLTTDDGIYMFETSLGAKIRIDVSCPGYIDDKKSIEIAEGENKLDFVLLKQCGLSGAIFDEQGNQVQTQSTTRLFYGDKEYEPSFPCVENGKFEFACKPGEYFLSVWAPGFLPANSAKIELVEGQVIDDYKIVLKKGLSISGIVVDETGAPVPDAYVTGEMDCRNQYCHCDEGGRFILSGLVDGQWILHASTSGYDDNSNIVTAKPGDTGVKLRLYPQGTVILHIKGFENNEDSPKGGRSYSIDFISEGYTKNLSESYLNSEYTVQIRPGTYKLKITINEKREKSVENIVVKPRETTVVEIDLSHSE
jgi:protocatechuate 3,4-dioxygenase beta subunit